MSTAINVHSPVNGKGIVMTNWHVFSEDHEIPGQLLVDFANVVGAEEIMPYFEKHGVTVKSINPTQWYPMQLMLDIYNDMETNKGGTMLDFVSLGMKSAENAFVPPEFSKLPLTIILHSVGEVFKLNNRGTDYGTCTIESISDQQVRVLLRTPTPDDIWYGVFYGFMRRFAPPNVRFTVRYDETNPRRDNGGDVTALDISWG